MRGWTGRSGVLAVLAVLLGLQAFRVVPVPLVWYMGSYLGVNPVYIIPMVLPVPVLTALAPLAWRWLGERRAARSVPVCAMLVLAVVRLAMQVARDPLADLALALVALVALSWWLLLADSHVLGLALPVAVLLDTASRSLLLDYDLAWRVDGWALIATLALCLAIAALALLEHLTPSEPSREPQATSGFAPWVWLGVGVWLALSLVATQNAPALMAATGLVDADAHLLIVTLTALGPLAGLLVVRWWRGVAPGVVAGVAVVITAVPLALNTSPGWLWFTLITLSAWAALASLLSCQSERSNARAASWRSAVALALGWVALFTCLLLDFYPPWGLVLAGFLLATAALWARRNTVEKPVSTGARYRWYALAAIPVLTVTFIWYVLNSPLVETRVMRGTSPSPSPSPSTLRVMTYNIHHGTDAAGRMDLQAIADAIAAEQPDVVALNEVSRGFVSTGYADTLWLVSRRLGMPYVSGVTQADGHFGNALLSRYPIGQWDNTTYANQGYEVRGVLRAVVDTPMGDVTFYATHLDHRAGDVSVRPQQAQEMLTLWAGRTGAVLLGDMNALPDDAALRPVFAAGLTDVLAASGQDDAYTYWNPTPQAGWRIDYVFVTPDLVLQRAWVPQTRASDHLPVVADISFPNGSVPARRYALWHPPGTWRAAGPRTGAAPRSAAAYR